MYNLISQRSARVLSELMSINIMLLFILAILVAILVRVW